MTNMSRTGGELWNKPERACGSAAAV